MHKFTDDIIRKLTNDGYINLTRGSFPEAGCSRLIKSDVLCTDILEIFCVEKITDALLSDLSNDGINYDQYKDYLLNDKIITLERIIICKSLDFREKDKFKGIKNVSSDSKRISFVFISLKQLHVVYDDTKPGLSDKNLVLITDSLYKYSKGIFYYPYKIVKETTNIDLRFYYQKDLWIPVFIRYALQAAVVLLFVFVSIADFALLDYSAALHIFIGLVLYFFFAFCSTIFLAIKLNIDRWLTIVLYIIVTALFSFCTYNISMNAIDIFNPPSPEIVIIEDINRPFRSQIEAIVDNGKSHYTLNPAFYSSFTIGEICKVKIYPNAKLVQLIEPCTIDEYNSFLSSYGFKGMSKEQVIRHMGKAPTRKERDGRQAYLYYKWNENVTIVFIFDANEKVEKCFASETMDPLDSFKFVR